MAEESKASAPALTPQDPWPGLASFQEAGADHFFGRSREIAELTDLIENEYTILVSGASGLGKTSLLQAGVYPRLRAAEQLPVTIRLDHTSGSAPYDAQVDAALARLHADGQIDDPVLVRPPGQCLWEYLHRHDFTLWDSSSHLLVPVFVFDQFEELFTRAEEEGRQEQAAQFLQELADLGEDRPPPAVPKEAVLASARCYKIVIVIRKDFLVDLENGLAGRMPSILHNRFFLQTLSGDQALEAVAKPAEAEHLLAPQVDEAVVRFAARKGRRSQAPNGPPVPLNQLVIEPAILSLICRQLNHKRLALHQAQITAALLVDSETDIVREFLDQCLAAYPPEVEGFLESLVTASGMRGSMAWDAALEHHPALTGPKLRKLVNDRVLRRESSSGGVTTVELVHDLLAREIHRRRTERLAALEERRLREEERARIEAEARAAQAHLEQEAEEARLRAARVRRRAQLIVLALIAGICAPLAAIAFWQKLAADAAHRETSEILSAYGHSIQFGRGQGSPGVVRAAVERQLVHSQNHDNPDLLEVLGDAQVKLQDWKGLEQTLATLEKTDPEDAKREPKSQRRYLRARLAEATGLPDAAVEAWERVLATPGLTDLERKNAYRSLGALYCKTNQFEKAVSVMEKGLQLAEVPLLVDHANLLVELRDWDRALQVFSLADAVGTDSPAVLQCRPRFDQIRSNLERLKGAASSGGFIGTARLLRELGLFNLALQDYREAWQRKEDNAALGSDLAEIVRLSPESAEAWHLLGLSQFSGGDPRKAADSLRRSLLLKPKNSVEVEKELTSILEELK